MHMNERGWHTAEALPAIIDALQRRGFALTTVGELIRGGR
jgi:peptidoglycan/xylan/chitin deacetylase (PgdA/CDA1 family)